MNEEWTGIRSDEGLTTTGTNILVRAFPNPAISYYTWPICSCHQKKSTGELIRELRDRLREEREVTLEAKGLISELQAIMRHEDVRETIPAIGANPEGGLP